MHPARHKGYIVPGLRQESAKISADTAGTHYRYLHRLTSLSIHDRD
jgi:hypothetical protein